MSRRRLARLDRNESPFGVSPEVLAAWERQRTADPRKYGLNRYPDFFHTDLLAALQVHHGLSVGNYTPLAGVGECGNVLAAALVRAGDDVVQPWPVEDPLSRAVRAWGGTVRRVALTRDHHQDLDALAAAVGTRTRVLHLQNPHSPTATSFSQAELEKLLSAVRRRNPETYVWIDETYLPYSLRPDRPASFALIAADPEGSRLAVSRDLGGAHGIAGDPTAYLAASRQLTVRTEGITTGFFVPGAYGWAQPEANVDRLGEKALLAMLTPAGERWLARVRDLNRRRRERLVGMLRRFGFEVVPSDASFLLARVPEGRRGEAHTDELRRRGVAVRGPRRWGRAYRGFVRVSVGSKRDLGRLERALEELLSRGADESGGRARAPVSAPVRRELLGAAAFGTTGALAAATLPRRVPPAIERLPEVASQVEITRRELTGRAALGWAGAAVVLGSLGGAERANAFPPDSFYDDFSLTRMIYHENPVGPSGAALEAVREVIARGARSYGRCQKDDQLDLVRATLAYNRRHHRSAHRLDERNVMLLRGSAEGLTLCADAFVAGGTLISEWPTYRIVRERVWQGGGTVLDVLLDSETWRPDYAALEQTLRERPETGLIHFNAQNNPAGTVLLRKEFDHFARWLFRHRPRTVILIDESDPEFVNPKQRRLMPDFPGYVARGENLVHLQTFSHAFALTGLRVGYLFAKPELIRRMQGKRIPRPVNVFGHAAALASLRDARPQVRRSYRTVEEGRRYLYGELDKLGLRYLPSQGQFLILDTERPGDAVWSALIAQGVLTRNGSEWDMGTWIRVNPGLADENERFIAALRTVLSRPDPANLPPPPIPLPKRGETRALRIALERKLGRERWIAERLPAFRGSYRETTADALRR